MCVCVCAFLCVANTILAETHHAIDGRPGNVGGHPVEAHMGVVQSLVDASADEKSKHHWINRAAVSCQFLTWSIEFVAPTISAKVTKGTPL